MKKSTLLKTVFAICFCVNVFIAKAQYVTIPDANFVTWLNANGFASCMIGNQMDTTCNAILNETKINLNAFINDFYGIQFFDNLDTLKISSFFSTTILFPPRVTYLDISINQFTNLPSLPDSLKFFNCANNALTSLPSLPLTLDTLFCDGNHINSLPPLPPNLLILGCSDNPFITIPSLPNSLLYFDCSRDSLTSLPVLPASLKMIKCSQNHITNLPPLPSSLESLYCDENLLASLPTFPISLIDLFCPGNQLAALPILPDSLRFLVCADNLLTSLPSLPNTLSQLYAEYNQLTSLPLLPDSLKYLYCGYNQLTTLPEFPDVLYNLDAPNNPNLTCLPSIKNIWALNIVNTGIHCVPEYGTIAYCSPPLSTLPLCNVFNVNNCPVNWNISGQAFADANSDCLNDSTEIKLPDVKIILSDTTGNVLQQIYSASQGYYSFKTALGSFNYAVDTNNFPLQVTCPSAGFQNSVLTLADSMDANMDFGMQCKPSFDVGVKSIVRDSGWIVPGLLTRMKVVAGDMSMIYGLHCAAGISGTVQIILDSMLHFVSPSVGALTPVVSGDTLTYFVSDFGTVNAYSDFEFIIQTDTLAVLYQQVCIYVKVSPIAGDIDSINNSGQICATILSSYDPNEKEVSPSGNIYPWENLLTYTIHFQNTGNFAAQNVFIRDTLDSDLDVSSFELLSYSNPVDVNLTGQVAIFGFHNINLPDSNSNEPASHGYIQYRVKLKPGLAFGTQIKNTSYIYFDFNSPVQTNTTLNTVVNTTGLNSISKSENLVSIFPNPVSDNKLNIVFQKNPVTNFTLDLFDISGRKVFSQKLSGAKTQTVLLPRLGNGIYQAVIRDNDSRYNQKVVVMEK